MEINVIKNGLVEIAEVTGRVDATNSAELDAAFSSMVNAGARKLLIDLKGLDYISSSGLRVFLLIAKKLEKDGAVVLCQLQPQVEQIFTISGFNSIFPIFANRDDGISHLNQIQH